jgi:hypothetical protein
MLCRRLPLAAFILVSGTVVSFAENLLLDVANNPVLQRAGSVVTHQIANFRPAPVIVNTTPAPYAAPAPMPIVSNNSYYDPFGPLPAAPTVPAPVIHQGLPARPPAGLTGGTVCQNGICQLAPVKIPVQNPTATVTPRFPPGYTGNTFAPASATPRPARGVSLDVAPVGHSDELSRVRADVLRVLPSGR